MYLWPQVTCLYYSLDIFSNDLRLLHVQLRPPQPAVYLFVLDVSHNAVEAGYLKYFCDSLLENLDKWVLQISRRSKHLGDETADMIKACRVPQVARRHPHQGGLSHLRQQHPLLQPPGGTVAATDAGGVRHRRYVDNNEEEETEFISFVYSVWCWRQMKSVFDLQMFSSRHMTVWWWTWRRAQR